MTVDAIALVVTTMGLAVVVVATVIGPGWRAGLGAALELWLAAGLLRLSADAEWATIAGAATIVAIRRLVAPTLLRGPAPTRSG